MVASGSMGTIIKPFEPLTWIVPKEWTLQEAATVPVVYSTVYCAFFMGKAISAGKSILIHAGSGGVGLAAIRVALAYNMEVYTTVSNGNKKKYILDLFPKLKGWFWQISFHLNFFIFFLFNKYFDRLQHWKFTRLFIRAADHATDMRKRSRLRT